MSSPIVAAAAALSTFFPSIGRWLGGAEGERIANEIVAVAQKITGHSEVSRMERIFDQNPKLLIEFQKCLLKLEQDLSWSETSDRNSARKRDMSIINAGRQNFRADVMVVSAALGLGSCLLALAFYRGSLPGEAVGIISTVAGIFGSCLKDAYSFEFGSSRGSKDKDFQVGNFIKRMR